MNIDLLSILAIVWVIYIFLFTEYDRQHAELFKRLKYLLALNQRGAIDLQQLAAFEPFGVTEMNEYRKTFLQTNFKSDNIDNFFVRTNELNVAKKFLTICTFVFTGLTIISFFVSNTIFQDLLPVFFMFSVYLILSGFLFYTYGSKLSEIKFIGFKDYLV